MKIATQLLKYVDVNADRAKELAQKLHIKKDELSFIRKFYVSEKSEVNEDERTVTARVSTNDRDRDGEVVDAKGIDFSAYEKNAVLLWSHRYSDPPIGKALWTKSDDSGLIVKFEFAKTQFADEIYQLYKGKFLNAFSIGFIPLDFDTETKTHKKISLLEVSAVPVPANENAVVMEAYQKGIIKSKRLKEDLEIEIEDDDQDIEIEKDVEDPVIKYFILLDDGECQEIAVEDIEAEEKEVEAKRANLDGNPSVWDIMDAIRVQLPREGYWISDLYPTDYPSGQVVIELWKPNDRELLLYDYTYADGAVTLGADPIEIEDTYKPKQGALESFRAINDLKSEISALNSRLDQLAVANDAKSPIDADSELDIEPEEKDADIEIDIEGDVLPTPKTSTIEAVKEYIQKNGIDVGKIFEIELAKIKGKVSLDD